MHQLPYRCTIPIDQTLISTNVESQHIFSMIVEFLKSALSGALVFVKNING